MTRFENRTLDKSINAVIIKANELLVNNSPMMLEILHKNDFKYESGSGEEVFEKIVNCKKVAPIFFYKPKWRFSKAIGYSQNGAIYLNTYRFKNLSINELTANLCHEFCHVSGLGHGNNYPSEDKNNFSVPYFVSSGILKGKWV